MNTKQTGDIGVAKVLGSLIARGFQVCLPWGDATPYDLVVDIDGTLVKVQVKTTLRVKDGALVVKTCSITTRNGRPVTRLHSGDGIDFIVSYDPARDCSYVLPRSLWAGLKGGQVFLRVAQARNGQSERVHLAQTYREAWDLLRS